MALDSPPWIIDATTVDAEVIRRAVGSLINPAGGIVTPGDLAVTQQGTPNMSVQVGTGQIWVPGTSTASQGLYYAENKAAVTLAIAASNPSNPRLDQVICQVQDAAYAGAAKDMQFAVVTGTPTSGASLSNLVGLGSVPASSLVIADVLVPAGATSIVTADIGNLVSPVAAASTPKYTNATASLTAAGGQMIAASPGVTVTLPPIPASGPIVVDIFAISTVSGASPVTVAAGTGTTIYGPGALGVSSFLLGTPQVGVSLIGQGAVWTMRPGSRQDSGWIALTPGSGMGATSGYETPSARITGDRVWFKGAVTNSGTASGAIGSLPATAMTPPVSIALNAMTLSLSTGYAAVMLAVTTGGAVVAQVALANGSDLFLDGLSYSLT